jgi:hypothetical protein
VMVVVENKPEYEVAEAAEVVEHCLNLLVNTAAAVEHYWSCCGGEEPECEVVKEAEVAEASEVIEAAIAEKAIGDYAWAVCRAVKTHP